MNENEDRESSTAVKIALIRIRSLLTSPSVWKFLIIGILSFGIDLGTLTALSQIFGVDLWIATPIAFIVSLIFNFWAQRVFTFQATNNASASFLKYGTLVVFNIFATDVIVNAFDAFGPGYAVGKVCATISTMVWNYLLYKYWIFRSAPAEAQEA